MDKLETVLKQIRFRYVRCCWNCKYNNENSDCIEHNINVDGDGDGICNSHKLAKNHKKKFEESR